MSGLLRHVVSKLLDFPMTNWVTPDAPHRWRLDVAPENQVKYVMDADRRNGASAYTANTIYWTATSAGPPGKILARTWNPRCSTSYSISYSGRISISLAPGGARAAPDPFHGIVHAANVPDP